jgi:hypothetical protein
MQTSSHDADTQHKTASAQATDTHAASNSMPTVDSKEVVIDAKAPILHFAQKPAPQDVTDAFMAKIKFNTVKSLTRFLDQNDKVLDGDTLVKGIRYALKQKLQTAYAVFKSHPLTADLVKANKINKKFKECALDLTGKKTKELHKLLKNRSSRQHLSAPEVIRILDQALLQRSDLAALLIITMGMTVVYDTNSRCYRCTASSIPCLQVFLEKLYINPLNIALNPYRIRNAISQTLYARDLHSLQTLLTNPIVSHYIPAGVINYLTDEPTAEDDNEVASITLNSVGIDGVSSGDPLDIQQAAFQEQ